MDLNSGDLSSILNKLSQNPEDFSKLLEESMKHMTPDLLEKAKKMSAAKGDVLKREMKRKGMDGKEMKDKLLQEMKQIRKTNKQETKKAIIVTLSRQLKVKDVPISLTETMVQNLIKSTQVVEMNCSRLALGPLSDKIIKVWYSANNTDKNKRASKIVGFPIGGELLIVTDGNLSEKDFIEVEKMLC